VRSEKQQKLPDSRGADRAGRDAETPRMLEIMGSPQNESKDWDASSRTTNDEAVIASWISGTRLNSDYNRRRKTCDALPQESLVWRTGESSAGKKRWPRGHGGWPTAYDLCGEIAAPCSPRLRSWDLKVRMSVMEIACEVRECTARISQKFGTAPQAETHHDHKRNLMMQTLWWKYQINRERSKKFDAMPPSAK
jgi:hypothetical protein